MIKIVQKDLFDSDAEILAHQVNVEGFMGAGIAKTVKQKYPHVFKKYQKVCCDFLPKQLMGNNLYIQVDNNRVIANLFAESLYTCLQDDRKIDYDALRSCFKKLNSLKKSIAIPYKIGCGLGGGDWQIVFAMIKEEFTDCDVEICSIQPLN